MTRLVTRLLLVLAIASLMFAVSGVAEASDSTTETIILMGNNEFPSYPTPPETPTTSSILLPDSKIYPLKTTTAINVQGEKWRFDYCLDRQQDKFASKLKILDSKDVVLWEDDWESTPDDLYGLLTTAETTNTLQWVKWYFSRKFYCGPWLEIRKIDESEFSTDLLEWSTGVVGMNKDALARRLTNGNRYIVFSYRKTLQENLMIIAFLPEIREFAAFSKGQYCRS